VRLSAQGQEVAQHGRIWEKEQVRFEPLHYLALLECKRRSKSAAGVTRVTGLGTA